MADNSEYSIAPTYIEEIETQDLIYTVEYMEAFQYTTTYDHLPTESELLADGIYYQDNQLNKNFTLSIEGEPTQAQFRVSLLPVVGTDNYQIKVRGFAVRRALEDLVHDSSIAFGYDIDNYTTNTLVNKILEKYEEESYERDVKQYYDTKEQVIMGILDEYGNAKYDYVPLDVIYDYFEEFPNINNPYIPIYKPLPTGENIIVDNDHSDFINNNVAYNNDGTLISAYTPLQLKNAFDYLNEHDTAFQNIMNLGQIVRIWYRQLSPTIFHVYVNGYVFENGTIVTSNETDGKQHYSGLITRNIGAHYEINSSQYGDLNMHLYSDWDDELSVTATFYNYERTGWFDARGLNRPNIAVIGSGPAVDSIGAGVQRNPIDPISTVHTKWYDEPSDPSDPYVPIGHAPIDPTVPTIEVQTIVRRGIPPIIIKPKPIAGVIPVPRIDPRQPPTFDDDLGLTTAGVNIYHPFHDTLSNFFDWLWDRDTWHDKQDMNSNPTESIISLHTLPLPDNIPYGDGDGETWHWWTEDTTLWKPLVLGYLTAFNVHSDPQSTIDAPIVLQRVVQFSLGHVTIPRTYLDYRDYNREIYVYIPYVGFKQIRCDDITPYLVVKPFNEARLYLDYFIDIATGDFQAVISIDKVFSDRKVLYTFAGNMATQIPLTATDKTRLEQARWNVLGGLSTTAISFAGAIGTAAAGLMPLSIGLLGAGIAGAGKMLSGLNDINNQNVVSIERCGSLAGNYGALAPKTPYVVINSPIGYDTTYEPYSGDSANVTIKLSNLNGFARCKYVHVDTLASVTLEERNAIEQALLDGVIF